MTSHENRIEIHALTHGNLPLDQTLHILSSRVKNGSAYKTNFLL